MNQALNNLDELAKKIEEQTAGLFDHRLPAAVEQMSELDRITMQFSNSFSDGLANLIVQGGKFNNVLDDMKKLLAKTVLSRGFMALLSGGITSGGGFFGKGGGVIGAIKEIFVDDALITKSGQIVKFHPDDNILAMKDFSKMPSMGGGTQSFKATQPIIVQMDSRTVWRGLKEYEYKLKA